MELNPIPRSHHLYEQLDDSFHVTSDRDASDINPPPQKLSDRHHSYVHAHNTTEPFDSLDQSLTLFIKQSIRWFGTAILIVFIIASLKIYETKGNFPPAQKDKFNTINIALNIGLSLNFFVSRTFNFPMS